MPSEPRRDRAADIRYIVGATGSGKTWYLQRLVREHHGRVLLWDWKQDHHNLPTARSLADFARRALTAPVLRYVPDLDPDAPTVERQFELFCRIAWAAQWHDPATDCLFIVEELSEVTRPERAPPVWRRINVQGRVLGFIVVGTTQSPAFVDKSFTGNATLIRAGRLGELAHARVIAQRINVDPAELQRLPDRAAYVYDGRKTTLYKPRR